MACCSSRVRRRESHCQHFLEFAEVLDLRLVLRPCGAGFAGASAGDAAMGVDAFADRNGAEPGQDVGVEVRETRTEPLLVELAEDILEDVLGGVGADEAPDVAVE